MKPTKCECCDSGCPHATHGHSLDGLRVVLYRIDMLDETGTAMCRRCYLDASESGLFTTEPPKYRQSAVRR